MTSERLFNSFIPPPPTKKLIPPKQISGYAPDDYEMWPTERERVCSVETPVAYFFSEIFAIKLRSQILMFFGCQFLGGGTLTSFRQHLKTHFFGQPILPLAPIPMRPNSFLRRWRYINHLLTYLLTYIPRMGTFRIRQKLVPRLDLIDRLIIGFFESRFINLRIAFRDTRYRI